MVTITNNGQRIGAVNLYHENVTTLASTFFSSLKLLTTVGFSLQGKGLELDEQLDEYLGYVSEYTNAYNNGLEQKMEFLSNHQNFDIPSNHDIDFQDAAINLKRDISYLLAIYDTKMSKNNEALETESDELLVRLEQIAGIKFKRFERVL